MRWDPNIPFDELPFLPPVPDLETKAVLKACISARAAVAKLDEASQRLPDSSILINSIPLLEARASSEIENIVTTSDTLFRHFDIDEEATAPEVKEALRYRRALYEGYLSLKERPLTTATAISVCTCIKNQAIEIRRVPGIALGSASGQRVYTPPSDPRVLRRLLSNWEIFLHAEDGIDPLIKMAAAHYQFEAIHPFVDGNGRTGRVINLLYLVEQGLLQLPVLYLSREILRNKVDYYRHLLGVTKEGAWEAWILFMLSAVEATALFTTEKVHAIRRLQHETRERVREGLPGVYSRELIDVLFERPYCRIENLVKAGIAERQTASKYLKALCEHGTLVEHKAGREKLFVLQAFLAVVTHE